MLERRIHDIRFIVHSPSHYQSVVSPQVQILFNGIHWFLMFGDRVQTVHATFQAALRTLAKAVKMAQAGGDVAKILGDTVA